MVVGLLVGLLFGGGGGKVPVPFLLLCWGIQADIGGVVRTGRGTWGGEQLMGTVRAVIGEGTLRGG